MEYFLKPINKLSWVDTYSRKNLGVLLRHLIRYEWAKDLLFTQVLLIVMYLKKNITLDCQTNIASKKWNRPINELYKPPDLFERDDFNGSASLFRRLTCSRKSEEIESPSKSKSSKENENNYLYENESNVFLSF